MNKTVLIAMIGLLTTLLVGQAVAGSITITRSGASVDEFVDGDNHSLEDSIYDHGILLGDGFGKATPVYRILLPPPTSGGNQITSITVTIEGNDAWLSRPYVYIGTPAQVSESIGDGEYVYFFTGSDARNLLDAVGDGLGYTLDVKIAVGSLTDKYDLKEIKVTYEYSGVSSDILERFAQAYSSYRTVKEYQSGMVDSLWNTGEWSAKEYFYPAVQQSLAFADNLSGLSGSPYDSLKSTINCIENFQSLAGILESAFDYTLFWISYSGPSKDAVLSKLNDARDSFQIYAQNLLNYVFDGDISSSDTTQLNSDIDTAKTKTTVLRQTMWDVGQESWGVYISHDNGDGKSTAQIMLYSLAPLLNITYDENSFNSEPSYLTGLIDKLIHFNVIPDAPINFVGVPISTHQIYLKWQDNSSNEDGFRLEGYLYVSNVGWGWFGRNFVGTACFVETPTVIVAGYAMEFRVRSFSEVGYSDWVYTTVSWPATMTVLETPSLLTASVTQQLDIALTWQNNAIYECRFSIERKSDTDGMWSEIALIWPFITEYVDTEVKAGETYYYRVKAISYESADYDSDYSPVAQVTIIQGDINADGSVDLADAILALQVLAGIQQTSTVYKEADVNVDGKIGLEEVIYILQKVSGLRK